MAQGTQATPTRQVVIRGRVERVTNRDNNGAKSVRTLVRTPAPDAYSSPGTFEIRSLKRLAAPGEEIEVACDLLGYYRSYDNKNDEKVHTAEHVLQAVA